MRITVSVEKHGLALEADLSRLTRRIQKDEKMGYHLACAEAEKRIDPVAYTQVIHTESEEMTKQVNQRLLGEHIAQGAPFTIECD